uniref:serine/threonine-protein kinase haspin isoform X2 n=1 Tax=Myxine glutinosa TaxID=7769 RepID=UPI00358E2974
MLPRRLNRVQIQNGILKKSKHRRLLLLSFESDSDFEPLKKCEVGKSGLKNSKKSVSSFAKNRKMKKRRKSGPAVKASKEKCKITLNANVQIPGNEVLVDKTPDRDGDQNKLGKLVTSKRKSPTMKENIQATRRKKNNGQHAADIADPMVYRDSLPMASQDADVLYQESQDQTLDASKDCPELLASQGVKDIILNAIQDSRNVTIRRKKVKLSKERLSVLVPMYPLEYEIKSWKKLISSTPNEAACSVHQETLNSLSPLFFDSSSMLTNNCAKGQIASPLSDFVGDSLNSLSCRSAISVEDSFSPKSNDTKDYSVVFSVSSPGMTSPNAYSAKRSRCTSKSVAKTSFSSRYLANRTSLETEFSEAGDMLAVTEYHFQTFTANKMRSNTHSAEYTNDLDLVKSSPFCKVDQNVKGSPRFQNSPGFENGPDAKQLCTLPCTVILKDVFRSKDLSLKHSRARFKGNSSGISQKTDLQGEREDQREINPQLSRIELSAECGVESAVSSRYLANRISLETEFSETDDMLAVTEYRFQPLTVNQMPSNTHSAEYKNDPDRVESSSFCKVDQNVKGSPRFQRAPGFVNGSDAKQLCPLPCTVILKDVFRSKDLSLKRSGVRFKGNSSSISQKTDLQGTREDQREENPQLSRIELSTECGVESAVGVCKLCRCGNNSGEDGLLHRCQCMGKSAKMEEAYFWQNQLHVSLQTIPCAMQKELRMFGEVTCKSPFRLGEQSGLHSPEFLEKPLKKKANVSGCQDQSAKEMFTDWSGQVDDGLSLCSRVSMMQSETTPQALGTCHLSGTAEEIGDIVDEELCFDLLDSNHETPNRRSNCSFMQDGTLQRAESCHRKSQLAVPKVTPRSWVLQKCLSFYHEAINREGSPSTPVQPKSSASKLFASSLPPSVSRVEFGSSKCQQWSRFTSRLTACRRKTVIYTPSKSQKPIGGESPCVGSIPKVYHALQSPRHVQSARLSMAFNTSLPVERLDFESSPMSDSQLDASLSDTLKSKQALVLQELSAADRLYSECDQKSPLPFEFAITNEMLNTCVKIGEGVFGEVYSFTNHNGETSALKIVPIEGLCTVNGEPQKTFEEILPEVVIAKELALLSNGKLNSTESFIKVRRIICVQGRYPNSLLFLWDMFTAEENSDNDRPDFFTDSQLYIIFEFENGGCDLEKFKLHSPEQGISVLKQVIAALAVAEETLKFEHRDLHWGNILIHETDEEETVFVLGGETHTIATHGLKTRLIDYTLSRLEKDGFTVFTNLATDDTLFTGRGDYQFDIYRKMKAENGNEWSSFHPHSNVLWLHYLAHKLAKTIKHCSKQSRTLRSRFTVFLRNGLSFSSASDLLSAPIFKD